MNYFKAIIMVNRTIAAWLALMLALFKLTANMFKLDYSPIEEKVAKLQHYISSVPSIVAGDYSSLEEDSVDEFLQNFESIHEIITTYYNNAFVEKPIWVNHLLHRSLDCQVRLRLIRRKRFVRPQPFGIIIGGPPGSGKTFGLQRLCTELYNLDHEQCKLSDTVILNEGDDFQSEFQSHHKIVIFDDLGATNVNIVSHDPFRKIIDFINNVPKTALNPHLDLKGTVWIEPDIVGATTNMKLPFQREQGRNTDSVLCCDALNRRFKLKVYQTGFDEFRIIPDHISYSERKDWMSNVEPINYDTLFSHAKRLYLDHVEEQKAFLELTSSVFPESSSQLTFQAIVAFQQSLRVSIGLLVQEHPIYASILVLARRFCALPLQEIKSHHRKILLAQLFRSGVSSSELQGVLGSIETITRHGTTFLLGSREICSVRKTLRFLISIITPMAIKPISSNWLYDILSLLFPFVGGKLVEKLPDNYIDYIRRKITRITDYLGFESKVKVEALNYNYLLKYIDIDFLLLAMETSRMSNDDQQYFDFYERSVIISGEITQEYFSKDPGQLPTSETGISLKREDVDILIDMHQKRVPDLDCAPTVITSNGRNEYNYPPIFSFEEIDQTKVNAIFDIPLIAAQLSEELHRGKDYKYYYLLPPNLLIGTNNPYSPMSQLHICDEDREMTLLVSRDTLDKLIDVLLLVDSPPQISPESWVTQLPQQSTAGRTKPRTIPSYTTTMTNKPTKKVLNLAHHTYPYRDNEITFASYCKGNVKFQNLLRSMGFVSSSHFLFAPKADIYQHRLVNGKFGLLYSHKTRVMYIMAYHKNGVFDEGLEKLAEFFKLSCTVAIIICSRVVTDRWIVPFYDDFLIDIREDMTNLPRYYMIKKEMFMGPFAKGASFKFEARLRKCFDQPICVDNLQELPILVYNKEVEDISEED